MAATPPVRGLGCEADVWGSRAAQPHLHAWSDDKPLRLGAKAGPAKAPEGQAVAWDGFDRPPVHPMLWRVVRGRPVSVVTCAFRAWLVTALTAQGQRARVLIWDTASWHVRQAVQEWINAHNRTAKHAGGCRLMVCRVPSTSPCLNPSEPPWVHGKRAVVEPARVLSRPELRQRICASSQGERMDPIAQPDCSRCTRDG